MSLAPQIYNYPRKIEKELQSIEEQLRKEDSKVLRKYYTARVAEGLSLARLLKYLNTLKILSRLSPKPLPELTKEDVVELIEGSAAFLLLDLVLKLNEGSRHIKFAPKSMGSGLVGSVPV